MERMLFIVLSAVLVIAQADNIDIDWSRVKPLESYAEFWKGKSFQPPSSFFEKENIEGRVIGGVTPGRHDFPFMVALISQMPFGDALCGATLISRWSVLTSAHCVYGSSSTVVILGGSNIENPDEPFQARIRVQSSNYIFHPFFREGIFNSDLAIVRFDFPIHVFTQAVRAVKLPDASMIDDLFANVNVIMMGFGKDSDSADRYTQRLRYVEAMTMSNLACSIRYTGRIDSTHICTSGFLSTGICHGDTGTPLVINVAGELVQIGVASFFSELGCQVGYPSVYARITSFMSWIEQNAE